MDYLFEHPSSLKDEGIAPLTGNPIRVAQGHPPADAVNESSPKSFESDFAQATQDLLMQDSPANRAAAARKLAKSGKRSATTYLIAALSDSSLEVRIAAAEALGQLGDLAEMTHLRDLLAHGPQHEMEERVISEAIHSIATREAKAAEKSAAKVNETQPINRVLNPVHLVVDANAQPNEIGDAMIETQSPSLTIDERLSDEEVALRLARQDFEQRRAESEKLRRAHHEEERVAVLQANRIAEGEVEQRNETEQKLFAEIEELHKAEAEQLERIERANTAARGRSTREGSEPAENEALEVATRSDGEEAETQLTQLQAIRFDAESEVEVQAAEKHRLDAEIKTLSKAATDQIDRMEQASARLTVLEQLRLHAETMVYQRAEREIRLEAEIAALRQAEAGQLKRIEQAEAEARQLAAARQQAAVEARKQVEEVTSRLAEEEEQRIEHLESIRCKAEAAAQERAEKERLLTSQLLDFGNAAAEQLKRIERAEANLREAEEKTLQFEAETRQKSEQEAIRLAETLARRQAAEERLRSAEAQAKQQAQEEERTIAQLEIIRAKAEREAQQRREQIQRLNADIEALRKIEVEQSQDIEETKARLRQMEADTRQRAQDEEHRLADLESLRSQSKRMGQHRLEPNGHGNVNSKAEVEIAGDGTFEPISTGHSEKSVDPVQSKEDVRVTSVERSDVSSVAEWISAGDPAERADPSQEVAQLGENDAFGVITSLFDDDSAEVRNGAARALYNLAPNRADTFTRALREASPDRRRQIITALEGSGLATEAIDNLVGDDQEKTNDAFSLLFVMARSGEFELFLETIEKHPSNPVRLSVIKLLTLCNQPQIIPAFRSLAVRGSLPTEVRSALVASIYEISTNAREKSLSAA